jgi:hypothetical protein
MFGKGSILRTILENLAKEFNPVSWKSAHKSIVFLSQFMPVHVG